MALEQTIELLYEIPPVNVDREKALEAVGELKASLNGGEVRAAEYQSGEWHVNAWVKKGILLAFRVGNLVRLPDGETPQFFDKDTMALKNLTLENNVRVVPGGSAIRDGAFVAPGVVIMPPSYINIGAYVDEHTMIDSHVLVGSCAQVGKRVHLSAGTQIGGVLEPIGSLPVIIEDDVFVGGNCGIYEGAIVRHHAVIGAGVLLTGSTPVYDLVKKAIYRRSGNQSLVIPPHAVVIAGSRSIKHPFAEEHHLSMYTPVIIKYRDEKTNASTVLEEGLR